MKLMQEAKKLFLYAGAEHAYRIGGGEFAAFRMDTPPEEVAAAVDRMKQALAEKGYHVSFGLAGREKAQGAFEVRALVGEAEKAMFSAKREYYLQPEHNRRSR